MLWFTVWCVVMEEGKRVGRFQPRGCMWVTVAKGQCLEEMIGNAILVLSAIFKDAHYIKLVGMTRETLAFELSSSEHLVELISEDDGVPSSDAEPGTMSPFIIKE